jgi:hypothetical protein|tara:strand:+ start:143 stop:391 length:249 start_codon:yes stop_codon:yes gene_type:complete
MTQNPTEQLTAELRTFIRSKTSDPTLELGCVAGLLAVLMVDYGLKPKEVFGPIREGYNAMVKAKNAPVIISPHTTSKEDSHD